MRSRRIIDEFNLVTAESILVRDTVRIWYFDKTSSFVADMGMDYLGSRISFAPLNVEAMPELIYICRYGI